MEPGHEDVAAVALLGHALEMEHVTVVGTMGCVARETSFHTAAQVLEDEGSLFVGMALEAGLASEASEKASPTWLVHRMAVHTLDHALLDAVAGDEPRGGSDFLMTLEARAKASIGGERVVAGGRQRRKL